MSYSKFRNDIELFRFDPAGRSFGAGAATKVELQNSKGQQLGWCVGGEEFARQVQCEAHVDIQSTIVGFIMKDRLEQPLFGDNSYLT